MHRVCAVFAAFLTLQTILPAAGAHAQAAEPFPVVPLAAPPARSHTWAYLAMLGGAGLVSLSFVLSGDADDAYADYLASSDQEEIQRLYDRAERRDHLAQASLLGGEAMFAAGLYLRFVRRPAPVRRVSFSFARSRCALAYRF